MASTPLAFLAPISALPSGSPGSFAARRPRCTVAASKNRGGNGANRSPLRRDDEEEDPTRGNEHASPTGPSNPEGGKDISNPPPLENLFGMTVQSKRGKPRASEGSPNADYHGDLLPFDVKVISPPPRVLGRAHLDPRTVRGDLLEYKGSSYLVRRVRMHFSLVNGSFLMTRKTAEVKSLGRKMFEKFLEELYDAS